MLGYFHLLAIRNQADVNMHRFFCACKFSFALCMYLELQLLDHMITMFNFLRECQLFAKVSIPFKFP